MADQRSEAGKRTVLDDLRAVPWPLAAALFGAGAAVTAIALILVAGGGGKETPMRRPGPGHVHRGANAAAVRSHPRREAESPPRSRVSLARMVGQRFMVGLFGAPTTAFLADVQRGEIGGVVLFPGEGPPVATSVVVAKLQSAARQGHNPPLLIAIDQEGAVKRFKEGPPKPLSELSASTALKEGQRTGIFLRRYKINADLAPVVDLGEAGSFIAEEGRTISADPETVTQVATAFSGGLGDNVMPVAKHFPGLGSATANTDLERSVVESGPGSSLKPYEALIGSGVPAIMLLTAIYTTLDPDHGAAWSPRIVSGLLRGRLGFQGLTISDDLASSGVLQSLSSVGEAVTDSAEAGVDMVMVVDPEAFHEAHETLLAAAKAGQVAKRNLTSSYGRILYAKERFAR